MDQIFTSKAFLLITLAAFTSACELSLVTDGNYSLAPIPGQEWLKGGPISFMLNGKWRSTADGTLEMDSKTIMTSGKDEIGQYQDSKWVLNAEDITMEAHVRTYPLEQIPVVLFSQRFPLGLSGTTYEANKTMSGFPTFRLEDPDEALGYLSFGSFMFGDRMKKTGKWGSKAVINDGLDGSGPLAMFDEQGNALVVAPYNNFMAASMWADQAAGVLNYGIMGGVDSLPEGFEYKTMVYCSQTGIADAFAGWGKLMQRVYNKTDEIASYHQSQDLSLTHLGYWTDNGAYYYYNTEQGKNYEETLIDIRVDSMQRKIPYRYMQLDSWFYFKDNMKAVTHWDAMETIFPKGIAELQDRLELPLVAHNRYWSVNTTYAHEHGGYFDFIIGKQLSLPTDQIFWEYLMGHGREEWGLIVYEQDWLNVQLLFTEELNSNLTLGRQWLMQMGEAALRHGLKIQYCMALSRHALQSLEIAAVTQARVSNDYHLDPDQWKIGVVSHFADAMNVAPSKDTYWTTSDQPGNTYGKQEPFPTLQGVVATLSRGPVGPGDMIGGTNITSLMRCCVPDGLVVKPSKPARAIDDQIIEMAFGDGQGAPGEVWTTYSINTDSELLFGIIFAANLSADYSITAEKAGFTSQYAPNFTASMIYSASGDDAQPFDESTSFTIKASDCNTNGEPFCLFYTSPVITFGSQKIVLLGDLSKWVPMSEQRVVKVWQTASGIAATLRGIPGEEITFDFLVDGKRQTSTVKADDLECATITVLEPGIITPATIHNNITTTASGTTSTTTASPASFLPPSVTTSSSTTAQPASKVLMTAPPNYDCRYEPPPITTPKPVLPTGPSTTPKHGAAATLSVKTAPYLVALLLFLILTRLH